MKTQADEYKSFYCYRVIVYYEKKEQTITAPQAIQDIWYDGESHTLVTPVVVVDGNTDAGSVTYSVDQVVWSEDVPSGINAGYYAVYYKVAPNRTYAEYVGEPVRVHILPAMVNPPRGLTATVGQCLGEIELPEYWSWERPDHELIEEDVGDDNWFRVYYDSPDPNYWSGWYDVQVTVKAKPEEMGEEKETATLTFDLGGGTLDGKTGKVTVEASVGDTITLPAAPTREGYTFKYWKGSQYAAGAEYKVEGDHDFTAVWEKDAATKTASAKKASSSGTASKSQTLAKTGDPTPLTAAAAMAASGLASLAGGAALRVRARRRPRG